MHMHNIVCQKEEKKILEKHRKMHNIRLWFSVYILIFTLLTFRLFIFCVHWKRETRKEEANSQNAIHNRKTQSHSLQLCIYCWKTTIDRSIYVFIFWTKWTAFTKILKLLLRPNSCVWRINETISFRVYIALAHNFGLNCTRHQKNFRKFCAVYIYKSIHKSYRPVALSNRWYCRFDLFSLDWKVNENWLVL